ncbi:hypothetical protein MPTK2_2g21700 [Marchantia polymorpha subsp. ruderalis]
MDPADEEPGLPSAVKDLIRRLEGEGEPLRWLPILALPDFQYFFPEHASPSTNIGWRGEVRLRVLEAIGSCNTFHSLDTKIIFGGDISRLTAREWEILLRGFRRSTVLRAIRVGELRWRSGDEVERLCLELGRILSTSRVKNLTIVNCRLSATCYLNLASGLRGNDECELESFELRNAWEDSSAVRHMADMISSATRLETLEIGGSGGRMYDMDEDAARTLSQALIQRRSLKKLVLNEVKGEASAFLLKALDGDDGNRAIECLHLISVSGFGDCLRELLRSNPYLKEVTLAAIDMRLEEWRQLGEAISENATARTIRVIHSMDHKDSFTKKGVEELACAASSGVKVPTLELIITFNDYDALMPALDFVGRGVLRGNIKSLESLILFFRCSCNHDIMEGIVPMDGNPGETSVSVLKRLRLFVESRDTLKGVWKYLLCCLRENTSVTHLDLSDSGLDDEAFRELMDMLQVNLTLEQIDVSRTAWAKDGKKALIQHALRENQNRACYMGVFREANLTFGEAKAGGLFLCGSPRAGKTRLRQTLMRIVQGQSRLRDMLGKVLRTLRIEGELLQKDERMQISIWDFVTLEHVIFPQTSNFCVFQFVYSPFCEKTSSIKPEFSFQTELEKWMKFITSNSRVTRHSLPQVLVVMSHKDKVKDKSLTWANTIVDEVIKNFANDVKLNQELFHVDARKKKQVLPVQKHIFDILKVLLTKNSPLVPHLCSKLTSLLVTKTKDSKKCPIWSLKKFHDFCDSHLKHFIPTSSTSSVDHSSIITSIISYMNDVGSIIYIPNVKYIIVDPNWLAHTLLGDLGQHFQAQKFESFDETSSYTSKDGYVSESDFVGWTEKFLRKQPHGQRGVDREMLENILFNLDLCFKHEDTFEYYIPFFIPEHPSTEKQRLQGRAHESTYSQNIDDTSQLVSIRIQCQDVQDDVKDGEGDRKDEKEDEEGDRKDGEVDRKDEEEDREGDRKDGEIDRKDEEEDREGDRKDEKEYRKDEKEDGEGDRKDEEEDGKDGEGVEKKMEKEIEKMKKKMKKMKKEMKKMEKEMEKMKKMEKEMEKMKMEIEEDGKDEEEDGKYGEGDGKDEEGDEEDGKDGEEDGKYGEGDEEDGKDGEEDGKYGEGDGKDEEGDEEDGKDGERDGKDEEEDRKDEDGEAEEEDGKDGEGDGIDEDGENEKEDEEHESSFSPSSSSCEEDGEDPSRYIIPSLDSKRASMEEHKHEERGHKSMYWYNKDENSQFVGIRIQCQDERRMSLTAIFFLRFQMFMRRKLISEMEVSKESVICSRHYLRLFLDGHQIYVQQGRNHEYVDVLMLCSKHKSRELAQKYVMKHIVEELISFCASPKGCPGVALVLGVIQTLCVEMLNPSHFRAILIEKLKSDFICSINDKLEEMMLESSHLVKKEELFNYEHRWPRYENQEGGISERARDLLWLSDVEAVVDCIRQKQIQKFESLQEDPNSLDNDLAQSNPEGENTISDSNILEMKDYKPSTSKWLSQESISVENRSTRIVLRLEIQILDMEMQSLEMMEMKIGETLSLQRLEMMEMKMVQILSLQREYLLQQELRRKHSELTAAMLSAFNSKVDKRPRGKSSSYLTREHKCGKSFDPNCSQIGDTDSGYGDAEFGNDGDEDWRDTLSAEIGDDGDEDGSDTLSAERVSAAARIAEKALRVDCSNAECFQF